MEEWEFKYNPRSVIVFMKLNLRTLWISNHLTIIRVGRLATCPGDRGAERESIRGLSLTMDEVNGERGRERNGLIGTD